MGNGKAGLLSMSIYNKVCCGCKVSKTPTHFYNNSSTDDGLAFYCKECELSNKKVNRELKKPSLQEARDFRDYLEQRGDLFQCSRCKDWKTAGNYNFRRETTKPKLNTSACKSCSNDRLRERKFGLSPSDYYNMLESQGNKCLLCGLTYEGCLERYNKSLVVDHCHQTGNVRGLLCPNCNSGLGVFEDNIDALRRAVEYVEKEGDIV